MSTALEIETRSAGETHELGRRLGRRLQAGAIVALVGELGSGKTVLVRGLVEGAGAGTFVASPTFVLQRVYTGTLPVRHFDLYRLASPVDLEALGFYDGLAEGISVIEWADRAELDDHVHISLDITGQESRKLTIIPFGERYNAVIEGL